MKDIKTGGKTRLRKEGLDGSKKFFLCCVCNVVGSDGGEEAWKIKPYWICIRV